MENFGYDCMMDYLVDEALMAMEAAGETLPDTLYGEREDQPDPD